MGAINTTAVAVSVRTDVVGGPVSDRDSRRGAKRTASGAPISQEGLWPLRVFQARMNKLAQSECDPEACGRAGCSTSAAERPRCVLLSTGSMNPPHRGHGQLLRDARDRLEAIGYEVVAGWISPSSDSYVQSKMQKGPRLSASLRLHLAEQLFGSDDFLSVGSWEALFPGPWLNFQEVIVALQDYLGQLPEAEFGLRGSRGRVRVFYVCDEEQAERCRCWSGVKPGLSGDVGVVIVRGSDVRGPGECASNLVFVADAMAGDSVNRLSRSILDALQQQGADYVANAMSLGASTTMLRPTEPEMESFPELAQFQRPDEAIECIHCDAGLDAQVAVSNLPRESWPMSLLRLNIARRTSAAERTETNKPRCVILNTGAMNPPHRGHVQMMRQARDRLKAAGYEVVAGWISPSSDDYVGPKCHRLNAVHLSSALRLQIAEQLVGRDEFLAVGAWEAQFPCFRNFPEVTVALQKFLTESPEAEFGLRGVSGRVRIFYVSGTDCASRCGITRGMHAGPHGDVGVVIVPREGEPLPTEYPNHLVFVAQPAEGEVAGFSSTKIRRALESGNADYISNAMSPATAQLLLTPTPSELEVFPELTKLGQTEIGGLEVARFSVGTEKRIRHESTD